MTEVEKIKAEIRAEGMHKHWGHELHALIDLAARAGIRDHASNMAKLVSKMIDESSEQVVNNFNEMTMNGAPIGTAVLNLVDVLNKK